tara:strand:- start:84 stop:722 length:639 start_codon:yes stop_codon:yes gene_type:complete
MNKINLVLDIDDTLIKTVVINEKSIIKKQDFNDIKIVKLPNFLGIVYIRPYLLNFLKFCFSYFNISFWTSGSSLYCREILKLILTNEQYEKTNLILARDNNNYVDIKTNIIYRNIIYNDVILKPLDLLFNDKNHSKIFNRRNTLIIDNNKKISNSNFSNSILIEEFNLNKDDIGLCYISNLLHIIKDIDDIRILKDININPSKDCNMISKFS